MTVRERWTIAEQGFRRSHHVHGLTGVALEEHISAVRNAFFMGAWFASSDLLDAVALPDDAECDAAIDGLLDELERELGGIFASIAPMKGRPS